MFHLEKASSFANEGGVDRRVQRRFHQDKAASLLPKMRWKQRLMPKAIRICRQKLTVI